MRQTNLRDVVTNPVVVTIPVNPLGGVSTPIVAQPPPEIGPVYQNVSPTFNIPVNGRVNLRLTIIKTVS